MNKKIMIMIAAVTIIAVGAVYAYRMNSTETCPPGMTGGDCCRSTETKMQETKSAEQTTASTEAHSCCPSGTEKKQ